MTKRDSQKDNIVLFPGLERRLLEKGMEALKEKKYQQAIEYLEQTRAINNENSEAYIGLVLACFESGNAKKAKSLAKEMLKKGIGDYIQVVDLYIMILVQLSEYEEIVTTIGALLEEKEIPKDKFEHFSKLLHFSRKMVEEQGDGEESEAFFKESEGERLRLFSYQDPSEQMLVAARLAKENIRAYIQEVNLYLESEKGHPFQKSMLLNILREQGYNKEVIVEKFGMKQTFIPTSLPEMSEMEKFQAVSKLLENELESEDPVLFENIKSLVERNFFLIYPFNPKPEEAKGWAAAYHFLANSYFGHAESIGDYAEKYQATKQDTEIAVQFIKKLEEISYPIL